MGHMGLALISVQQQQVQHTAAVSNAGVSKWNLGRALATMLLGLEFSSSSDANSHESNAPVLFMWQVSAAWGPPRQICRTDERWSPRHHSSVVAFRRVG